MLSPCNTIQEHLREIYIIGMWALYFIWVFDVALALVKIFSYVNVFIVMMKGYEVHCGL